MRRTHLVAAVVAGVLAAAGLVGDAHPRESQVAEAATAIDDPEAYAVYAAILEMGPRPSRAKATRYLVRREAGVDRSCALAGEPDDPAWRPVLASFASANAAPHVLLEGFSLGLPYSVVSREEIEALFVPVEYGWSRFYGRYPGTAGYEGFSAVGFDADKTRALVYTENHCHYLCGYGSTTFLRKEGGRWRRATVAGVKHCEWIS